MLLQDKVGLVTGAGAGIGRATALTFARDGARVAVADNRLPAAEKTAAMIREAGGDAIAIAADISDEDQVADMVAQVMAHYGRLDCACNNAAMTGGFSYLESTAAEVWDLTHRVSLKGVWLCLKYEIAAMLDSGGGSIVNIASLSGVRGEALQAHYSAAKSGVIGLTRSAAAENARRGIRVNAINPGGIRTGGMLRYFRDVPGAEAQTAATHAMRRLGEPEEVADAVAYLCSDRASFITGTSLDVDGGIMVNPHTL
jgi:NAD(P)-dependent dehydrogenase (short-subunit alcohol dehydrogenase family)